MMTDVNATLNSRANTHGDFRNNGNIMQALKNVMRSKGVNWPTPSVPKPQNTLDLTPEQCEALDMIQHKIGRILSGNPNEPDHWHDIAGYATLVENILRTGNSHIPNQSA